jgi:hypothetical protein
MATQFFSHLLQQASARGGRSSALNPLAWLALILVSGTVGSHVSSQPAWVTAILLSLTVLVVLVHVWAYVYFMFKSPDALRSERFSLEKMAMERGLFGDTRKGFLSQSPDAEDLLPLPGPAEEAKK